MQPDFIPLARLLDLHGDLQNLVSYVRSAGPNHRAATTVVANDVVHVSIVSLLGRLVVSLTIVLGFLWGLAHFVKRRGITGGPRAGGGKARSKPRSIDVLTRQSLGKGQALVTVRLDDRILLLGVTPQSITNLSELDSPDLDPDGHPAELEAPDGPAALAGPDLSVLTAGALLTKRHRLQGRLAGTAPGAPHQTAGQPHPLSWSGRLEHLRSLTVRR
jgi:flagellar biosynthetic protein FliO